MNPSAQKINAALNQKIWHLDMAILELSKGMFDWTDSKMSKVTNSVV